MMQATIEQTLTLTTPSDFHIHLRDGEFLNTVVNPSSRVMHYVLVMPNLTPPITTTQMAMDYKKRILSASSYSFKPLITLYMTESMSLSELDQAKEAGIIGLKLYPSGATTNSENGVKDVKSIYPLLERMQELDLPLLLHGEVVDSDIDIFDREKVFIEKHLEDIVRNFPNLRIVFEHITTRDAVEFVNSTPANVAATITPQHLLNNRNDMLVGGIKPHYYCLPILKAEKHRLALVEAAISGSSKFFLGTDSAPHLKHDKESSCGCAGCFNSPHALSWYAQVFERAHALDKLEGFASLFAPRFYNLPAPSSTITLIKYTESDAPIVDTPYYVGESFLIPYNFGKKMYWDIQE